MLEGAISFIFVFEAFSSLDTFLDHLMVLLESSELYVCRSSGDSVRSVTHTRAHTHARKEVHEEPCMTRIIVSI